MNFLKTFAIALALSLASLAAQAAVIVDFVGSTDDVGPQLNQPFSGSLRFDPVPADFSGTVDLTEFTLNFLGETYTLGDADLTPVAWFDAGNFLGVDFSDFDDSSRASVGLTAGFFDVSEAFFSYGSANGGVNGFGSVEFVVQAVPVPGTLALAGLGVVALVRRRRA